MSPSTARKSNARQRIVETAERLFYAEGVRAVGIDRIIAEAGVAKMTLYNHFASKDDLILAVLQYREEKINAMFAEAIERHVAAGEKRLEAFFTALKEWFESRGFRGCAFINAAIELADCEHPGSQFAAQHKQQFHTMIEEILRATAGRKGATAAPAVALLVEGAIITALMQRSPEPADTAREAALALVARAKRK